MTFISYAQNFEDVLLWRALGHIKNGFYIDVGANDPELHSVTKAFYDAGWYGINIEPLPSFHRAFLERRPRDINLAIAAGAREDSLTLYDVPAVNGWASLDPTVADAHRAEGFEVTELTVPLRTLANVCLDHVRGDIHFLKVDVEGFEREVLRGMDFVRWRPWVLAIEATLPNSRVTNHETWEPLVTGARYHFAYFDGLNRYYVADEHKQLLDVLSIQPNVFDDFITHHLDKAWRATDSAKEAGLVAERKLWEAGQRADQAVAASREAIALANDAVARADQARQAADANAQQAVLWARGLEQRLVATHNSWSWRLTAPLRGMARVMRAATGGSVQQRAHRQLVHVVRRVTANQFTRRLLVPLLTRFPSLDARVSQALGAIKQTAPAQAPQMDVPEELRELPASARKVLADLKRRCRKSPLI